MKKTLIRNPYKKTTVNLSYYNTASAEECSAIFNTASAKECSAIFNTAYGSKYNE